MSEKRYIYASVGISFEILDSYFGYTGDDEPTEREIEEYDYLVIGLASNQDSADGICRKLNELYEENEQLKSDIIAIEKRADKVWEENEQLKKEYNKLKHRHSLLHDVCIEAECDRDRYHKDVLSLEKENEQLKEKIKALEDANTGLVETIAHFDIEEVMR